LYIIDNRGTKITKISVTNDKISVRQHVPFVCLVFYQNAGCCRANWEINAYWGIFLKEIEIRENDVFLMNLIKL